MKWIKYSLFIILFLSTSLFVALNNDKSFKFLFNYNSDIKITQLEKATFRPWFLSFSKLSLSHENLNFNFSKIKIYFSLDNFKVNIDKIQVEELSIHEYKQNEFVASPSTQVEFLKKLKQESIQELYQALNALKLEIALLELNSWRSKQAVLIENFEITQGNDKVLITASTRQQHITPLHLQLLLEPNGEGSFNARLNEDEYLRLSLSKNSVYQEDNGRLPWVCQLELKFGKAFTNLAKQHLRQFDTLSSQSTQLALYLEHDFIKAHSQPLALNLNISSHWDFKERPHTELPIKAITLDTALSGTFSLSNNELASFNLSTDEYSFLTFSPIHNATEFNTSDTFKFLSQHSLKLSVEKNAYLELLDSKLSFNDTLAFTWADSNGPAFINLKLSALRLNPFNAGVSFNTLESASFKHSLQARWNKNFSSHFKGQFNFKKPNESKSTLDVSAYEENLKTQLSFSAINESNILSGQYSLSSIDLSKNTDFINRMVHYWEKDLDFTSGIFEINGNFKHPATLHFDKDNFTHSISFSAKQIHLNYDGYILNSLNYATKLEGKGFDFKSKKTNELSIDEILAGATIKHFKVNTSIQGNLFADSQVLFDNMQAELLGGKLQAEPFTLLIPYNPVSAASQPYQAKFIATLKGVQLDQVLALAEKPEIQGRGILDGELPIFIDENLTLINKGKIRNRDSGFIQYKPDKTARENLKQNPQMALAIDVLGHLNYHTLNADIDLDDRGKLLISGDLKGLNPDYHDGYPIEFTPNIELDFTDMLRSMQIGDTISNRIDKRANTKTP